MLVNPLDQSSGRLNERVTLKWLTSLAEGVPAFEIYGERQNISWGATQIIMQKLTERKDIGTQDHDIKKETCEHGDYVELGPPNKEELVEVLTLDEAKRRAAGVGGVMEAGKMAVVWHGWD